MTLPNQTKLNYVTSIKASGPMGKRLADFRANRGFKCGFPALGLGLGARFANFALRTGRNGSYLAGK